MCQNEREIQDFLCVCFHLLPFFFDCKYPLQQIVNNVIDSSKLVDQFGVNEFMMLASFLAYCNIYNPTINLVLPNDCKVWNSLHSLFTMLFLLVIASIFFTFLHPHIRWASESFFFLFFYRGFNCCKWRNSRLSFIHGLAKYVFHFALCVTTTPSWFN